jgi:hypothetical protein
MTITYTYNKADNNTATLPISLAISAGYTVGLIVMMVSSATPTAPGSCADNATVSNTYTNRASLLNPSGYGWTVEAFTAVNVSQAATVATYTPPTGAGTIFGMSMAGWVLNPNGGVITWADVASKMNTSSVTGTDAIQSNAALAMNTPGSFLIAMGTDMAGSTLSAGTGFNPETVPTAGVIPQDIYSSSAHKATWTDTAAGNGYILAALSFDLSAIAGTSPPLMGQSWS